MPRLLITGGAGFIGFTAVKYALSNGWTVRVLDNITTGQITNQVSLEQMGVEVIVGDVRDEETVEAAMQNVEAVLHLAAQVSVPLSIKDPEETYAVNIEGTKLMLAFAAKNSVSAFIMASSAAVYGDQEDRPLIETTPDMCLSPYAESKLENEKQIQNARLGGLNATAFRLFNVYGGGQQPNGAYAAVIPKCIDLMSQGESPVVYGDGEHTRDFVHVQDVVEAMFLAISMPLELNPFHVYNIGSGKSISLNELIGYANASFSKHIQDYSILRPTYHEERPGDIRYSMASIDRIRTALDWSPSILFEDGIYEQVKTWMGVNKK